VTEPLRAQVERLPWYHVIELPGGVVTPGVDDPRDRLPLLALPDDLSGMSVLDIGAWDGFFSFECERRGAARVVAADWFAWREAARGSKESFELARAALGSRVEDVEIRVEELSPERVGTFDLVLFVGVLYHLRDPLLALEAVASVTHGKLILETHVDLSLRRGPAAAFYAGGELRGDHTNWWGPNPPAVMGMLRASGFDEVEKVFPRSRAYELARAVRRRSGQGRAVFHARRGGGGNLGA
jgi:tRNA (mo5U34)-methyltransferase